MHKRNFDDFVTAFTDYARDGFVPEQFNLWSALSIVAGALERKVWLPMSPTLTYYPNIYVMLVSMPGMGKSTALNRAVNLLTALKTEGRVNYIPSQVTEAKFIELMGEKNSFQYGPHIIYHNSGYYFASEASNSLKDIYGDLTTCFTDFYDCPPYWEKATKKDGKISLGNVCFNLLAGSTFDYLGKLVTDDNIKGGFASRLIYVVSREERVVDQEWGTGQATNESARVLERRLIEDLRDINAMTGPFSATDEFKVAWKKWNVESQERRIAVKSENMKSVLVRLGTSMHKLCMLFSASEASDRVLRIKHFEKTKSLLETMEDELPKLFKTSRGTNPNTTSGLKNALLKDFHAVGDTVDGIKLKRDLLFGGFEPAKVHAYITELVAQGALQLITDGSRSTYKILVNPNDYI